MSDRPSWYLGIRREWRTRTQCSVPFAIDRQRVELEREARLGFPSSPNATPTADPSLGPGPVFALT